MFQPYPLGGVEFDAFVEEGFFDLGDDLLEGVGSVGGGEVGFGGFEELDHVLVAMLATAEVEGVTEGEEDSGEEREGDGEEVEEEVFAEREKGKVRVCIVALKGEAFEEAGDDDRDQGSYRREAHPEVGAVGGGGGFVDLAAEVVDLVLDAILEIKFLLFGEGVGGGWVVFGKKFEGEGEAAPLRAVLFEEGVKRVGEGRGVHEHAQGLGSEAEVEPGVAEVFAVGLFVKVFGVADEEDFQENEDEEDFLVGGAVSEGIGKPDGSEEGGAAVEEDGLAQVVAGLSGVVVGGLVEEVVRAGEGEFVGWEGVGESVLQLVEKGEAVGFVVRVGESVEVLRRGGLSGGGIDKDAGELAGGGVVPKACAPACGRRGGVGLDRDKGIGMSQHLKVGIGVAIGAVHWSITRSLVGGMGEAEGVAVGAGSAGVDEGLGARPSGVGFSGLRVEEVLLKFAFGEWEDEVDGNGGLKGLCDFASDEIRTLGGT